MSKNSCEFIGNFTADPELRAIGQKCVANFTIAVNGKTPEDTVYVQCDAWEKTAENIAKYCTKGHIISIRARYYLNKFVGKDGEHHSRPRFRVLDFDFLPNAKKVGGIVERNTNVENVTLPATESDNDDDDIPF